MFTRFKKAIEHSERLTLIMTGDPESLTVVIIADPKKDGVKVQPIRIKGTYEQVSEELDKALDMVFTKNDALLTNAEIVADGIKKEAEKKTSKATEKKTGKKAATPAGGDMFDKDKDKDEEDDVDEKDDDDDDNADEETTEEAVNSEKATETNPNPAGFNANQKKAEKAANEVLTKARQSNDADMISFLKKQAIAIYEKAKMPANALNVLVASFDSITTTQAPAPAPVEEKPAASQAAPAPAPEPAGSNDDIF